MRLVSYRHAGRDSWGLDLGSGVLDAVATLGDPCPASIGALLSTTDPATRSGLLDRLAATARDSPPAVRYADVRWLGAVPDPRRNIFCLGVNYQDHVEESGLAAAAPQVPVYFTKATTTVSGHRATVRVDPAMTSELDWEVELGVVIGTGGRSIPVARALEHVFGYTVINDLSARDQQHGRPEGQWFLGKSLDGLCPMGPALVTRDEIPDPQSLRIELSVNGVRKQHASTSSMIFGVAQVISDLSRYLTLLPGDVISTGTPGGVGGARTPPEFLRDGDVVVAAIAGIGQLESTIAVQPS